MAVTGTPLLSALMSPAAAARFLGEYWPHRAFTVQADPARWPEALRCEELASFQNLARSYRGSVRFTHGRRSDRMVQIDRINPAVLYDMGLTLQFEDVTPCLRGAGEFLRSLEHELGLNEGAMSMSAFASPAMDGLPCHYDAQDLISIQLHGTKRFHYAPMREIPHPYGTQYVSAGRAFEELYPQALDGFPKSQGVTFTTAEMKPGTVLFLPRGTWHYTEAGEPSLSLSLMINPPAAADVLLDQLRWLLLQDSAWRRPLYGACASGPRQEEARGLAARLLSQLPSQVASLTPDHLLAAVGSAGDRLRHISPASRFMKTPNSALEVDNTPSSRGITLRVCLEPETPNRQVTARMEISPEALAMCRWIADREAAFSGEDVRANFPRFTFEEIRKILIALTQAQLIRLLWFAPLASPLSPADAAPGLRGHGTPD